MLRLLGMQAKAQDPFPSVWVLYHPFLALFLALGVRRTALKKVNPLHILNVLQVRLDL